MDHKAIIAKLQQFNKERDWDKFHNLKDLAAAINIEAGELQELFLWAKAEDSQAILDKKRQDIEEEVADIFAFLTMFCYKANIDLEAVIKKKIDKNDKKYPVEKVKGQSKKYTEY